MVKQGMRNIKLTIQYDGTNYSGWQFQKNAKTIQEAIEARLKKILGEDVKLIGAGRTDAGVHAKAQVANLKTRSKIPLENLQMALNSALPKDIVISNIAEVSTKFHSQHDARAKIYRYTIMNSDFVDPLLRHFAAKCFYKLNLNAMRRGARHLLGKHNFKVFQKTDDAKEKNAICTLKEIRIEKEDPLIYIYIEADSFLYNMARNIVGTLIEVGRGKIRASDVKDILLKRERGLSGPTVAAKGLCLMEVKY